MAAELKKIFSALEPDASFEDESASVTGAECGNLFFRFQGTDEREAIFFNCHMDTVEPGRGVKVQRKNDIFTSVGKTILGSDDKSGIAALIEALRIIREKDLPLRPLECVFTTCEEIGLLGAKALKPEDIQARFGYALDSSGFGQVIIGAPACNRLTITVRGVAAHAGLHPEWGINAITLAGEALAQAPCGRLDAQSTVNFGTICGGMASNIVAEEVVIEGEVRSHSPQRLEELTRQVEKSFSGALDSYRKKYGKTAKGSPSISFESREDFPLLKLEATDAPIVEVAQAARSLEMPLTLEVAGGGSDANIFNGYGLKTAIIATGMTHVHSTDEQVSLDDMTELTRLILAILTHPFEQQSP